MTDAERIAELEEEIAYLKSELAMIDSVTLRSRMVKAFSLTAQQSRVLHMLYAAKGRTLSKTHIHENLPELSSRGRMFGTKTVEVHILGVRKALGRDAIQHVQDTGYRIPPAERSKIAAMIGAEV